MTETTATVERRTYDETERERWMLALAEADGNARKVEREHEGAPPERTLYDWRKSERYGEIRATIIDRNRLAAAEEHRADATLKRQAARLAAERLVKEVGDIDTNKLAGAVKDLTTAGAIDTTKADELQGVVNPQGSGMDPIEILRGLQAMGAKGVTMSLTVEKEDPKHVNATAEEIRA